MSDDLRRLSRAGTSAAPLSRDTTQVEFASVLSRLGYELGETDVARAWDAFERLAERKHSVTVRDLEAVQRRREPAARRTQALQLFIQRNFIGRALTHGRPRFLHRLPALLRLLPFLPRIPGYLVGLGFRPEHLYEKTMPAS